jgi:L-2-hydroxyglutarate oxidase
MHGGFIVGIELGSQSTLVLNAVSPAFTSSAPFAEHVVSQMNLRE